MSVKTEKALRWLTVEEVSGFEGISAKQVRRRIKLRSQPALIARLEPRAGGGTILMIDPRSMTFDAQQRYKQAALLKIAHTDSPAEEERDDGPESEEGQGGLFAETLMDRAAEQARSELPPSQFSVAMQRFKIIQPLVNHDFAAVDFERTGFSSKVKYSRSMARMAGTSLRSVQRWRQEFKSVMKDAGPKEAFIALADERPGPERGTKALDNSMKAFITARWLGLNGEGKLTRKQICRALRRYLEEKQHGCGAKWAYEIPSDSTVCRFINAAEPYGLGGDANPLRGGAEGLKKTCGYIDQSYDDEAAGDAWCIDEKEIDGVFYNPLKRREIYWSIYAVSVIDERTTKILGIKLAYRLNADTVLDLLEEVLSNYWAPKWLVSDRGGHFRGKVLRRTAVQSRSKLIDRAMGAMDSLGVEPRMPREKNPRASRIERIHRIYSDFAQRDFGPSWRGRNVEERKMTAIDERVERHIREHCKEGTSGPLILSTDDAERFIASWAEEINLAQTDAKGCAGMTRQAAFEAFKPAAADLDKRRVSRAQIDEAFAERDARVVRTGGIIEAADGLRYSSPELIARTGSKVPFSRLRRDRTRIYVEIDGGVVVAPHRVPTGKNDPDRLAREAKKLARINKLYSRLSGVPTLENAPCADPATEEVLETAQSSSLKAGRQVPMTAESALPPLEDSDREPAGIGFSDLE